MTETNKTTVAIACQGGGSHTAFTAGVLQEILRNKPSQYEIIGLSGTSGGAMCATLAWDGLRRDDPEGAIERLEGFWDDMTAHEPWEQLTSNVTLWGRRLTSEFMTGPFGVSPYWNSLSTMGQQQLREAIERHIQFDDSAPVSPPHLFIGAVNVETGSFEVFTDNPDGGTALKIVSHDEREDIPLEDGPKALLASAAYPYVFRAVEIEGPDGAINGHWDGLFSQNPPIRHFTIEEEVDQKPDEIWIIRINPIQTGGTPRSQGGIADRRNELTGNLSLQQETHMIEAINKLIRREIITHEKYKYIELREVELKEDVDHHSKLLNRNPAFLRRLMDCGVTAASDFWTQEQTATAPVSD